MEENKKILLKNKLEDLKRKREQQQQDNERKRIVENIDDFYGKYRFANESESKKIEEFMGHLKFTFPAHISIPCKTKPTSHKNMYLCFLGGSKELLRIYVFGNYQDFMLDIDDWDFFSAYLLLIDENFSQYIYIDDNGTQIESSLQ